ncbi:MAG: M23 family metallopeptidase [Myxococcales bacterium]|nr:M23 family metallopeptidase [Myxococcales bacterium]MCB9520594.1 M23 family metallopeptidase [Myxococcales bacterium]MCB9531517.1 M23 family metallopeptidase [Myxococcales bacterium]
MRSVHRQLGVLLAAASLVSGCATVGAWIHPSRLVAGTEPSAADSAFDEASAVVSLALASASLRLLELDPTASRTLSRGGAGGGVTTAAPEGEVARSAESGRVLQRTARVDEQAAASSTAAAAPRSARRGVGEVWAVPVAQPRVTSRFGPRIDPITGEAGRMHRGLDFGATTGTDVMATASGTVVLGGYCDRGTGNCVVIDHAGGWRSQYFHLSAVRVRPGQQVTQGQVIGQVGSTGRSTGPHLHFQLGRDGVAVDPETLLGEPVE